MAESRKIYTQKEYYAKRQQDEDNIPDDFKGLGYYRRTSLEDAINNFMVAYIGEDKALAKVPRYEIDFWAQRAIQEFSYDILHSEKSIEIELGDALTFPLPQDYVSYTKISKVNDDGSKARLLPSESSSNPQAILQDDTFNYTFDSDGELALAAESESIKRYQDSSSPEGNNEVDDQTSYSISDTDVNSRYGSTPSRMNSSSTFVLDEPSGLIYFDGSLQKTDLIVLEYISDGLSNNGDLTTVYIPKLAEDALYAFILYNLAKVRPAAATFVALYKKEASAKMRNAKIRLSNYKLPELAQVLRGKSKWIKH